MYRLDVSIVVHEIVPELLYRCVSALSESIDRAREEGALHCAKLWIGFNGNDQAPQRL
jgi:hypothetical protein